MRSFIFHASFKVEILQTKNVMTVNPLFALLNVFCHQYKPRVFLFFDKSKLPFINQTWFLTFLVTLLFSYKNYKFKLTIFSTIIVLWDFYLESALSFIFFLKWRFRSFLSGCVLTTIVPPFRDLRLRLLKQTKGTFRRT
jgi:hypothetical protein